MTYYEVFQLEKYGNILPSSEPVDAEHWAEMPEKVEIEQPSFEFPCLSDHQNEN